MEKRVKIFISCLIAGATLLSVFLAILNGATSATIPIWGILMPIWLFLGFCVVSFVMMVRWYVRGELPEDQHENHFHPKSS